MAGVPTGRQTQAAGFTATKTTAPPTNQADIDKALADGKERAKKAQARFSQFFYVVSDASFKTLRPARDSFYTQPEKTEGKDKAANQ